MNEKKKEFETILGLGDGDDNDDEIILNSTTRKQIYVMITNGYDNNNNTNSFNNFKRLIDRTASMHLYNTFLIISK